jgi:O-antigen ligase
MHKKQNESEIKFPDNLLTSIRTLLFIIFYFLCLRQLLVFYHLTPQEDHVWYLLPFLSFLLFTLYNKVWALYGIFISVPIFTGLEILHIFNPPYSVYSLLFSSFFLFWFPYKLFTDKGDLSPSTEIGNLTDLLSGIVICSLAVTLTPFLQDIIKYYIWLGSWENYNYTNHLLPILEFAFVLLQGFFLCRAIESEFKQGTNLSGLNSIIIFQGIIILLFSLIQLFCDWPVKLYGVGVYSPLLDFQCFGNHVSAIFFILLFMSIHKKNIYILWLCVSFFILSVLSFSRAVWAQMLINGLVILFFSIHRRKYLIIPLVFIGIVFLVGTVLINYTSFQFANSTNNFLDHYLNRFLQMLTLQGLNERVALWMRAINIILDFPLTGSGIGTFYRYSALYQDWDTSLFRNVQEHSHNYFLQFAAELGLPALITFLSIFFYLFKIGLWVMPRDQQNGPLVKGILFGISVYLSTSVTGCSLIFANQVFLFWFLIGSLIVSYRFLPGKLDFSGAYYKTKTWKIGLTILLVIGYAPWIWGLNQRKPLAEMGFYSDEFSGGTRYHWTTRKTTTNILSRGTVLEYELRADPQFTKRKPQHFMLTVNGQPVDQRNFYYKGSQKYIFYLPPPKDGLLQIKTEVDQVVNFNRVGLNRDTRDLGVVLSEFRFSDTVPEEGIGFYENALYAENLPEGWPSGVPLWYRWTALRASVKIPPSPKADLDLFLYAGHPDISRISVRVKIFGEEKLLREEPFSALGWRKITLHARQLQGVNVLTFQTDRVWNPKMVGVSDDTRDLGIAVAIP